MSAQQEAAIARFLLDNGADANDFQKTGASTRTPLMSAAAGQDVDLVKLLLSRGADPNARDERAETAVSLAASTCLRLPSNATEPQIKAVAAQQKAQLSVVEALLQAGARASGGTESGSVANCCGHQPQTETQMSICKLLLQNK
jgi:hypothetical protein